MRAALSTGTVSLQAEGTQGTGSRPQEDGAKPGVMWPQVRGLPRTTGTWRGRKGGPSQSLWRARSPNLPWPLDLGRRTPLLSPERLACTLAASAPAPHPSRLPGRALTMRSRPISITVPVTSLAAFPTPGRGSTEVGLYHLGETPTAPSERAGESPGVWGHLPCPHPQASGRGSEQSAGQQGERTAVPGQLLHLSGY